MDTSTQRPKDATRLLRPSPSAGGASPASLSGRRIRRRGAVLLVALVVIIVAAAVFVSVLKLSVAERRRVQTEAWQVQAAWLAESGMERAAAQLAADPLYRGETWSLSADHLGAAHGAVVRIEVDTVQDQEQRRLVHCEADYPDHPQQRARHSKQVMMDVRP
jgi:Tfp pilus assembly protein PilV